MNPDDNQNPLPEPPANQQQSFGDVQVQGDDNLLNVIQAQVVTLTQTKIIQISVDKIKTRELIPSSPYKGLKKFEPEDSDRFFGRDQFIGGLVNELEQTNFVLLLGASGSGKSSVVRAGLVPWLQQTWGKQFVSLVLTPDHDPFESFYGSLLSRGFSQAQAQAAKVDKAETLSQVVTTLKPTEAYWLIFIDQFEELFTVSEAKKRDRFIQNLVKLSKDRASDATLKIVATMRADFLDQLDPAPANRLARLTEKHRPLITQMHPDELRLAIEQPAAHHGVVFETGLVEEIIKDVQGQAGYLPLLQYTLDLLWESEAQNGGLQDRTLRSSTYRQLGGVRGALQQRVDEIYLGLSEPEQLAAQRIFLKLVEIGDDEAAGTGWKPVRRRAARAEFADEGEQWVLTQLINANLLVSDASVEAVGQQQAAGQGATVEIAHEILLTSWTTLHGWIKQNRQSIALRNRLNDDVALWQAQKADSDLWGGSKLARVVELRRDPVFNQVLGGFSAGANQFIEASVELRERQRRRVLLGMSGFSMVALALAGFAGFQWRHAQQQATVAQLREQVATVQNLLPTANAVQGMILAIDAIDRSQSIPALRISAQVNLLSAVQLSQEVNRLQGHGDAVTSVAFSPDSTRIVSGSADTTVRLWDSETGQPIGQPLQGHDEYVYSVAFSPDGTRIVSGSADQTIRLWDAETGQPIGQPLQGHDDWVTSVAFSPDGTRIVSGSDDKTVRLWDVKTGQPIGQPLQGHEDFVTSVAFSPDGTRIVSGSADQTIRLWDSETGQPIGQPLQGHDHYVWSAAFSPDGTRIISGSEDKTVQLWDAETGQPIGQPLQGHHKRVMSVAFSPDGTRIVSGSVDQTIRLWDAKTGQLIGQPWEGRDRVMSVAFSPDGTRIVSGVVDQTVRLWDAEMGQPIGQPLQGHDDLVHSVAFSPDGIRIISGGHDKTMRLWDAKTGQPIGQPLQGHDDSVTSAAFSPDGTRIVSGSADTTLRLWDAETGQPIGQPLQGHDNVVNSAAFSFDSTHIVSSSDDKTVRLWDAETGQPIGQPLQGHNDWIHSVAFSPDGTRIVSGSGDKTVRLWDTETGQPIGQPLQGHDEHVTSVAFSPDGTRIVSGSGDKTVRLWDTKTGQPIGQPLQGHEDEVHSVAFSPDGTRIVSGSFDKTVRLWDAETGQPIGQPLQGHGAWVYSVAFSPDGTRIISGGEDNTVRLWDANADWLTIACNRLQYHPLLNQPETVITDDPDFLQVAQRAKSTCQQKVWNQTAPPTSQSPIANWPLVGNLPLVTQLANRWKGLP
ncbi:WD40 repeat domain-containing protein [Leptolyngbya sp. CCNP1308]|uniref:WD40 repeat domain-containing protein n=1 Tax=Leptolyngbya sp. CCNP1308 TaxID=3110255 RepID=UPI002B20D78A|nr:WD40 repeat domain-containing protein [Leptolyngbya sp. CCNP1308]MEA5449634.1 WD40 repeat domain-containing protein [Leptolyngbya sp. CCNP1308]